MLKSRIHFLDEKLRAFKFSNLEILRVISPSEKAQKFLDGKGVSAPQKLGGFFKKMVSKNNDFSRKNPQKVQKY